MLNIAICDDDVQTTGRLEMLIQQIANRNFVNIEVEVFWDGESLVHDVMRGSRFDIIYLDIEMKKENGISAAKKIRVYDKSTHNRRERPIHGHRGGSRGRFYYRITTFEERPWDARDPHKTTFMALSHAIGLSI